MKIRWGLIGASTIARERVIRATPRAIKRSIKAPSKLPWGRRGESTPVRHRGRRLLVIGKGLGFRHRRPKRRRRQS